MIEILARIRCDVCMLAVECPPAAANPEQLPCNAVVEVPNLPGGWTRDLGTGKVYCAPHRQRLVEPVAGLPASLLRGN